MTGDRHHKTFLKLAVDEALRGVRAGQGGPFGAVVVKNGAVLASGCNQVIADNDPTAHAEIQAIRAAGRVLGSFQLSDCDVYASCEPCPMCLGALYWARPRAVYFASSRAAAELAGFDDAMIYAELARPMADRVLPTQQIALAEAQQPFDVWVAMADRVRY